MVCDLGLRAMLELPRYLGADGVVIWGHLDPNGRRGWATRSRLTADIHERWTPVLASLVSDGEPTPMGVPTGPIRSAERDRRGERGRGPGDTLVP